MKKIIVGLLFFCGAQDSFASVDTRVVRVSAVELARMQQLREERAQKSGDAFLGRGPHQGSGEYQLKLTGSHIPLPPASRGQIRFDYWYGADQQITPVGRACFVTYWEGSAKEFIEEINQCVEWFKRNEEGLLRLSVDQKALQNSLWFLGKSVDFFKSEKSKTIAIDYGALVEPVKRIEQKCRCWANVVSLVPCDGDSQDAKAEKEKLRNIELARLAEQKDDTESFRAIMQFVDSFKKETQEKA